MDSLLRHLRLGGGVRQAELAAAVGVSQGHISDVEVGRRPMTSAFAMKAAPELGVDPVVLLCGYEYEMIARKAEEGDASAPREALALAQKLLELLEELGAFDEERASQVRQIVEKLLDLVDGKPVAAPRVPPDKPAVPIKPVGKAAEDVMGTLRRLGAGRGLEVLTEDEAYDRLVEEGLSAEALEGLLDDVSARMGSSLITDAERLTLESIQAAAERRIAELTPDGARSGYLGRTGDYVAAKSRASAEAQEARDYEECMHELGLDMHGRPIPAEKQRHDAALKSAGFFPDRA